MTRHRGERMDEVDVLGELSRLRIVPVVTLPSPDTVHGLGEALCASGLSTVEITLRSQAGLGGVRALAERGDIVVGAGTVLTPQQVDDVADAGGAYVVSPGLDPAVVERARERGILALPGGATASELQRAHALGLRAVKFFPAELLGGVATIRALSAAFPGISFFPSGGIDADRAAAYLSEDIVVAVSGSWMLAEAALRTGDVTNMTNSLRRARTLTRFRDL